MGIGMRIEIIMRFKQGGGMRKVFQFSSFIISFYFIFTLPVQADTITFQNGDRLTGKILEQSADKLTFLPDLFPQMEIKKSMIASQVPSLNDPVPTPLQPEKPGNDTRKKGDLSWTRKLTAGYSMSKGNSETQSLSGDFLINRNHLWIDEWTLKGNGLVSSADRKTNANRYSTELRYAFNYTQKLYHFFSMGAEHDYFQNVNFRLIPKTGLGYWFVDQDDIKLMVESGVGYQMEWLRTQERENRVILHERLMTSKKLGEHVEVGFDGSYFPTIDKLSDYRVSAETFLRYIFTTRFALKIKLQDEYRSYAEGNQKRNDLRLIFGLEINL